MTRIQKLFCGCLCICFLWVLAMLPEPFSLWSENGNIYWQLPLYRYLREVEAEKKPASDPETSRLITEKNGEYLAVSAEVHSEKEERTPVTSMPTPTPEEKKTENSRPAFAAIKPAPLIDLSMKSLTNYEYLLGKFFIVDENTATNAQQLDAKRFLKTDLAIKKDRSKPQILIYHSHSQEEFADSREGVQADTVVGVGNYLEQLLRKEYGYNVMHIKEAFDLKGGELDRSRAYDYARESLEKILQENPSIEVLIDLHRDGVPEGRHLVTKINGKDTAQIMFYNGLSYTLSHGNVEYLPNPYIQENLAFSFQLEYEAARYYPTLYRGIYLAGLRYNLHLRPRAILLEVGAQTNTVEEVKNAMEPFADILDRVLGGERK